MRERSRHPGDGDSRTAVVERAPTRSRRSLMAGVGRVVAAVGSAGDVLSTVTTAIDQIVVQLRDELGITGGRLYERDQDSFVLRATFGDARPVPPGLRVPASYPPLARSLEKGVVVVGAGDQEVDRDLERKLGVCEFAAVELGAGRFILGLDVMPDQHRREVALTLGLVRISIDQTLAQVHAASILAQARAIQASILPRQAPAFPPFDVAGRSIPLETVGGDLFDFIGISDNVLGLVVADVAGHGFPAALQVRDVYTGLRMGLGREYKMTHLIARLNRIIHQSTLTSRFVSLFYGELEQNGTFIYVNAGHPPALHVRAGGTVKALTEGGPVLGPLAETDYHRGFAHLRAGDLLVLYTDGISEAEGGDPPSELGTEGLADLVRDLHGRRAEEVIDTIHQRLDAWRGTPARDDRTVVVVARPQDVS